MLAVVLDPGASSTLGGINAMVMFIGVMSAGEGNEYAWPSAVVPVATTRKGTGGIAIVPMKSTGCSDELPASDSVNVLSILPFLSTTVNTGDTTAPDSVAFTVKVDPESGGPSNDRRLLWAFPVNVCNNERSTNVGVSCAAVAGKT